MHQNLIKDIRFSVYRIPLHCPFVTAHGNIESREGLLVSIRTVDGMIGIGEIAPLPSFAGRNLTSVSASLSSLANYMRNRVPSAALALFYTLIALGKSQVGSVSASAASGLECALLDLVGQLERKSIAELLRGQYETRPINATTSSLAAVRAAIPVNAVIGTDSLANDVRAAQAALDAGYTCVKLKVGKGDSDAQVERVAAVRHVLGDGCLLRLDANEGWDFEQAVKILSLCEPYNIQYVEQPLVAQDLTGMRRLRQSVPIAIAADEAVSSLASARVVLEQDAADVLIIKPQLAGGLRASRQIIRDATRKHVKCVVTSSLESGIGIASVLQLLAASPEVTWACGLSTLPLLEDDLILDKLHVQNGMMRVPNGIGLGIQVDQEAIVKYGVNRE